MSPAVWCRSVRLVVSAGVRRGKGEGGFGHVAAWGGVDFVVDLDEQGVLAHSLTGEVHPMDPGAVDCGLVGDWSPRPVVRFEPTGRRVS